VSFKAQHNHYDWFVDPGSCLGIGRGFNCGERI
jgi:hypothetical protein